MHPIFVNALADDRQARYRHEAEQHRLAATLDRPRWRRRRAAPTPTA